MFKLVVLAEDIHRLVDEALDLHRIEPAEIFNEKKLSCWVFVELPARKTVLAPRQHRVIDVAPQTGARVKKGRRPACKRFDVSHDSEIPEVPITVCQHVVADDHAADRLFGPRCPQSFAASKIYYSFYLIVLAQAFVNRNRPGDFRAAAASEPRLQSSGVSLESRLLRAAHRSRRSANPPRLDRVEQLLSRMDPYLLVDMLDVGFDRVVREHVLARDELAVAPARKLA